MHTFLTPTILTEPIVHSFLCPIPHHKHHVIHPVWRTRPTTVNPRLVEPKARLTGIDTNCHWLCCDDFSHGHLVTCSHSSAPLDDHCWLILLTQASVTCGWILTLKCQSSDVHNAFVGTGRRDIIFAAVFKLRYAWCYQLTMLDCPEGIDGMNESNSSGVIWLSLVHDWMDNAFGSPVHRARDILDLKVLNIGLWKPVQ